MMLSHHFDPAAGVILWGSLLLFFGILGRYLAQRCHQPGVVGELLMGVMLGNLCYASGLQLAVILRDSPAVFAVVEAMLAGTPLAQAVSSIVSDPIGAGHLLQVLSAPNGVDWVKIAYVVDIFSRYGVIFLLFVVGLETSINDLRRTGRESLQVALIGIVAPIVLGLLMLRVMTDGLSFKSALFVAATLSATSVGITARVLKDMQKLRTRAAKTILGAAMLDDILGLIILAIVSGIVMGGGVNLWFISRTIVLTVAFFALALYCGPWVLRKLVSWLSFLEPWETKLLSAFLFLMGLAWLATTVQLATIIGAFVAGMIIHEGFFATRDGKQQSSLSIKNVVAPFEAIFAPLFFMLMGIQVKLEMLFDWHVLMIGLGLVVVAIVGKLVSGLGAAKGDDRLLIGIGMLPRGEVGLIFASIGKVIGVVTDELFAAIVLMVVVTTILAPIWLKMRYSKVAKITVDKI